MGNGLKLKKIGGQGLRRELLLKCQFVDFEVKIDALLDVLGDL